MQTNLKFRSQVVIGFYIADFVIPEKLLIIEVDGSSHDNKQLYDARRDQFLTDLGFSVIHIQNKDVEHSLIPIISSYPFITSSFSKYKNAICTASRMRRVASKKKRSFK